MNPDNPTTGDTYANDEPATGEPNPTTNVPILGCECPDCNDASAVATTVPTTIGEREAGAFYIDVGNKIRELEAQLAAALAKIGGAK